MNITPITSSTPATTQHTTSRADVKPLTQEIDEPVRYSISGEGIFVAELAARSPDGHKAPKISQSSIKALEFDIKLMQQMKTMRLAGESTGNNIEDLANAYDYLQKNLNENSDNSQKHSNFLNEAFSSVSRYFFAQDARQQYVSTLDLTVDSNNPNVDGDVADRIKQVIADAEKNSALFADSFLKNYKKHGLDAYKIALSSLQK